MQFLRQLANLMYIKSVGYPQSTAASTPLNRFFSPPTKKPPFPFGKEGFSFCVYIEKISVKFYFTIFRKSLAGFW